MERERWSPVGPQHAVLVGRRANRAGQSTARAHDGTRSETIFATELPVSKEPEYDVLNRDSRPRSRSWSPKTSFRVGMVARGKRRLKAGRLSDQVAHQHSRRSLRRTFTSFGFPAERAFERQARDKGNQPSD